MANEQTFCFECGAPAELDHHVVPKSRGGTRTVPLCGPCHDLVHDAGLTSMKELSRIARKKKKLESVLENTEKHTTEEIHEAQRVYFEEDLKEAQMSARRYIMDRFGPSKVKRKVKKIFYHLGEATRMMNEVGLTWEAIQKLVEEEQQRRTTHATVEEKKD